MLGRTLRFITRKNFNITAQTRLFHTRPIKFSAPVPTEEEIERDRAKRYDFDTPLNWETPNLPKDVVLPNWFKELVNTPGNREKLFTYDVMFIEPENYQLSTFSWDKHVYNKTPSQTAIVTKDLPPQQALEQTPMYHIQNLITKTDLVKLSGGKNKRYLLVAEAYGLAESQDLPTKYSASSPSYLWLDFESSQPKFLVQLSPAFPPLLWIPIKPEIEAMNRFFRELILLESTSVGRHLEKFDLMLTDIGFGPESYKNEPEKLRDKLLSYLNEKVDPNTKQFKTQFFEEHPNHAHFFLGNVSSAQELESHLMNNPFVFNTPILLGSSNRFVANNSVVVSMFRTVYSRATLVIECRLDLNMELGDGGQGGSDRVVPVFVHVMYPDNQRVSRPAPDRMNRIFNTNYPENMPIDVIGALFGQVVRDAKGIYKEFKEMTDRAKAEDDDSIPSLAIAHLGVLRYERFEEDVFNLYHDHKDPYVRLACIKGAIEMGLKSRIEECAKQEKTQDILDIINKVLANWKENVVNGVRFPIPKK
ncbi:hypothetical protein AKO1_005866 [Acrasis kona]|uniref:Uncharacterized protein n=1 Tax=Acrasis kona TaxID=1008807 RepID=A0AAW2YJQ5_9EUKA